MLSADSADIGGDLLEPPDVLRPVVWLARERARAGVVHPRIDCHVPAPGPQRSANRRNEGKHRLSIGGAVSEPVWAAGTRVFLTRLDDFVETGDSATEAVT